MTNHTIDNKLSKVIVDCDNTMGLPGWEVDDGLVIFYLLGREDIDVLGITNTFGNGSLKDVEFYTKKLLFDIGRSDIPRFTGEPFMNQNPKLALDIRKGGDRYAHELKAQSFPSEAAVFLSDTVNKYPGEVTILALGPVGNLYDAWKIDHDFFKKTKEIVLMGGYTGELFVGDVNCRELNLSCNPVAANRILRAECPVIVFNGHICLQAPFYAEDLSRLEYWPEDRLKIVTAWLSAFAGYFKGLENAAFYLWDLLPAVYVSHPELFDLKNVVVNPSEESLIDGMLNPGESEGSVEVIMPDNILDVDKFMDVLEEGWRKAWELEKSGWKTK
ncbi:MAG: nucleoside hydrolase [Spirochaetales bacterium]|nr:nucleoside hydrolase [Spirochaetales bacterium]